MTNISNDKIEEGFVLKLFITNKKGKDLKYQSTYWRWKNKPTKDDLNKVLKIMVDTTFNNI